MKRKQERKSGERREERGELPIYSCGLLFGAGAAFFAAFWNEMITAKLTAYDANGVVSHQDTRDYPDTSLLWEHIGAQQHNRRTVRVHVQAGNGLNYKVEFSPWTAQRRYSPSRRFQALLDKWSAESSRAE